MKLFWKLNLGYMTLVLGTTIVVGLLVARWLEEDNQAVIGRELSARTELLSESVPAGLSAGSPAARTLQARVQALGERVGTRFTVILPDGTVVADSERDPAQLENHATRPEFVSARQQGGLASATRYSKTLGVEMMYTAFPVRRGDQLVALVRSSVPLTEIDDRLAQLRQSVFIGALLALVVALIPGFLIAKNITGPLVSVTDAAGRLAAGEEAKVPSTSAGGEVGELTRAFATMAEQLRERFQVIDSERSQLFAILASMVEGVVAIDREERIVHLNEVARRLLGTEADVVGVPIWKATQVQEASELLRQTLEADASSRREVTLSGAGRGSETVLELHAAPLRSGTEQAVAGAVLVLHDVTALRRLETHRQDFVANVSHELKTPLTAIYGLVETLLDDPEMDAKMQRRFLGKVHKQAVRLSNLVGDVLTLSKVESNTVDSMEFEPLDLRDPILTSARMRKGDDEDELEVDLQTDLPDEPVRVLGDREGLRQVVDNLLGNAIKYTPAGGNVWLRLRTEEGFAVFEVQDTGLGIEPHHQERIFERFYRVDKARSRELGGTGLGLSIVKHVAIAHGGTVSLDSTPGVGSTFRVRLPLAPLSAGLVSQATS